MKYPDFEILPWNGFKAAISLTFDDGDPTQLQVAIPEMNKRNIRGTFYLISNRLTEINRWKEAVQAGQEIGNHSLDHKHAIDLSAQEAAEQVTKSKRILENMFQAPIPTFAYPFTEITPALRKNAEEDHFLSRGGYGPVYFRPHERPDWAYLASQVIYAHTSSGILKGWTDENIRERTWSIPQFHAFQGGTRGWQPYPPTAFIDFLDDLSDRRKEIWVAPIGEVGAYWMAQGILEKAGFHDEQTRTIYRWKKPILLPQNVRLKTICKKGQLYQAGKKLTPNNAGQYEVSFDAEELTFTV